jgi:ubiquinone/menaquinone biosynthesis C-methylase UbiE
MPFTNHYFDTITLSNALHHIEDTQKLFIEIKRVCKIGGSMVINEMLNEGNAAMQDTYMQYHRFMAEIDRQLGQFHREPFSLKELTALVKNYQLLSIEHFVHAESTGDAMNASEIDAIADRINKKVTLLKGADFFYFFENKARELIERLRRSGIYRPRHAFFLVRV